MRDALHLNESLKLQLDKSRAERVADQDVRVKLQDAEQQLEGLHREFQQQQQRHEVWNEKNNECKYVVFDWVNLSYSDNVLIGIVVTCFVFL